MATKVFIKQTIIDRVEGSKSTPNYSAWQIGLTHDPEKRKKEWDSPMYWEQWQAASLADAEEIESFFINEKSMMGGTGGDLSPSKTTYVYII